jgi:putative FmdB family regulatory protein
MPSYLYKCSEHGSFELFARYTDHRNTWECPVCGEICKQVITSPMLIIPKDIRYVSPATGALITSEAARKKDMANSECIEYEPGMKQDYHRRIIESDNHLDKLVDETVEREVALMPVAKREALETAASAFDADIVRI